MAPVKRLFALILMTALAACTTGNPELVWQGSDISMPNALWVPDSRAYKIIPAPELNAAALPENIRLPVVVYLHGHAGPHGEDIKYVKILTGLGYPVLRLNSTNNPGWKRNPRMSPSEWRGHSTRRRSEVFFALERLQEIPWVDKERLVLFGYSQGGQVAGSWSGRQFAGIIITGANCGGQRAGGTPRAPRSTPVLAIKGANDYWFAEGSSCNVTGHGPGSRSILIPGKAHTVAHYPETQEAIRVFLGGLLPHTV